jgi:hypothetical protein
MILYESRHSCKFSVPTESDQGKLSVDRESLTTPKASFDLSTAAENRRVSSGRTVQRPVTRHGSSLARTLRMRR